MKQFIEHKPWILSIFSDKRVLAKLPPVASSLTMEITSLTMTSGGHLESNHQQRGRNQIKVQWIFHDFPIGFMDFEWFRAGKSESLLYTTCYNREPDEKRKKNEKRWKKYEKRWKTMKKDETCLFGFSPFETAFISQSRGFGSREVKLGQYSVGGPGWKLSVGSWLRRHGSCRVKHQIPWRIPGWWFNGDFSWDFSWDFSSDLYTYPDVYIWLVVWLEHQFFIFPEILGCDDHPNWRTHIFSGWGG